MAVKFKFAMKNSLKEQWEKTMERTGRKKKCLARLSLAGFELVTTGLSQSANRQAKETSCG